MQAVRKFWLAVAAAGLIALWGFSSASAVPTPAEADPTSETSKWVLEGSELVLHINVRQVLNSAALKKGAIDAMKEAIDKDATAKMVFENIGLDPLKDIDSITLSGLAPAPKDVKGVLVVRGKFNLAKIQNAAEKFAADKPTELKLSKSDGLQLYEIKAKENNAVAAFADSTTLVVGSSKELTLDAVKRFGRRSARVSKDMELALTKFTGKESLSLALVFNEELRKLIGKAPGAAEIATKLKTVTGTLALSDTATLGVIVLADDEEAATILQGLIKQGLTLAELVATGDDKVGPLLGEFLKATKLVQQKTTVSLTLTVTEDLLQKAMKKQK
jgi:hypothetical protein